MVRTTEARKATASVESLEGQLADLNRQLAEDQVFVAGCEKQGGDPKDRTEGTRKRIEILSRKRDGIARELDLAKSALVECRETVGA